MSNQPKPVQPHSEFVEMYSMVSDRNHKFTYIIAMNSAGEWSCSCPSWIYAKPRATCKHITRLLEWRGQQTNMPEVVKVEKRTRFSSVEV
jgi:hypothetical protein